MKTKKYYLLQTEFDNVDGDDFIDSEIKTILTPEEKKSLKDGFQMFDRYTIYIWDFETLQDAKQWQRNL